MGGVGHRGLKPGSWGKLGDGVVTVCAARSMGLLPCFAPVLSVLWLCGCVDYWACVGASVWVSGLLGSGLLAFWPWISLGDKEGFFIGVR